MITTIIIDDERPARELLEKIISRYLSNQLLVIGSFASVKDAKDAILVKKPQLVFLDIQMGDGSGFDLFQMIQPVDFEVVFTTAYQQYAMQAIRYAAFDYILKPINYVDLLSTVKRLSSKMNQNEMNAKITALMDNLVQSDVNFNKIALPSETGLQFVSFNDIIYLEADGNYTKIVLQTRQVLVSKTLKVYEDILPKTLFYRIHKSFLVNLNHIRSLNRNEGNTVVLSNKMEVPVSVRKLDDFIKHVTYSH